MGLPAILDRHIPRHWKQKGLSWGWVATIWLAHIISQGDHRKLTVRDWVKQAHTTLEETTDMDFADDRLSIVLRELSKPKYWQAIERDLGQNRVRVYDLSVERVHVDATTISGYHAGGEESLFQFGKSKDNPALRQVKLMMGTLGPLGLPMATAVVSGEQADDGLYVPIIDRIVSMLVKSGLSNTLGNLGGACYHLGEYTEARQYLHEALQIAHEIGATPATLKNMVELAPLLAQEGQITLSLELLAFCICQSAITEDVRERAAIQFAELAADLDIREIASTHIQSQRYELDAIVTQVLGATPEK